MADSTFGLLSQYGLDLGSEADVRTQLRNKRIQDAMTMVAPPQQGVSGRTMDPGNQQQSFGRLGATLGNALGEKFGQRAADPNERYGAIPPEIANRLKTVEGTKKEFETWKAQNPEAKQADLADKYQEALIKNAFANDLPDVGISALRELQDRRLGQQKKEAELEKIGYENRMSKETIDGSIAAENIKNGKAGLMEVYPVNSRDPNTSYMGHYDPKTRTLTTGDGQVLPEHMWKVTRPDWDPVRTAAAHARASGAGKLTPSEGKYIRDKFEATIGMHRKVINVFKLLLVNKET